MKIRFEHDISHNYMIPEPENEEENLSEESEMDYEVHMLEENQIRGFMRCIRKRINGETQYYYEITSKHSLAQICETDALRCGDIQKILGCLHGAMQQMEQYLLDGNKLVLDPMLIYLDIESRDAEFCYLPSYKKNIQESFRSFASYLLYHLNQADTEAVLRVYEINRKVQEKNYALLEILQEEPETSEEPGKTVEQSPARERKKPVDVQIGFLAEDKNAELRIEKDKKESKNEWKRETKKKQKQKEKNQKTKKIETRKEHSERKTQMLTGMVYLVVMGITGIAAWMDFLTVTQAGGITFLITAALAYVLSWEKGREKNGGREKKKKETGIRWELPESEEEPWLMKDRNENGEIHHTDERKQNTEAVSGGKSVQKMAKVQTNSQNLSQQEEENVGTTTLLWKGEEEYEPHLTLISMNPRERNSIVLVKDSYLIGKLKTKADICLEEEGISRIHAKIQKEGEEYYLCDMNSTNGTFINGRRLGVNEKVPLHVSDEIAFARTEYYIGNC